MWTLLLHISCFPYVAAYTLNSLAQCFSNYLMWWTSNSSSSVPGTNTIFARDWYHICAILLSYSHRHVAHQIRKTAIPINTVKNVSVAYSRRCSYLNTLKTD
ncbi:unnamed protein product [Lepidochelys kempii]